MSVEEIQLWLLQNRTGHAMKRRVLRAAVAASVGLIWDERKERIFCNQTQPVSAFLRTNVLIIHVRTMHCKKKRVATFHVQ